MQNDVTNIEAFELTIIGDGATYQQTIVEPRVLKKSLDEIIAAIKYLGENIKPRVVYAGKIPVITEANLLKEIEESKKDFCSYGNINATALILEQLHNKYFAGGKDAK